MRLSFDAVLILMARFCWYGFLALLLSPVVADCSLPVVCRGQKPKCEAEVAAP